MNALNRLRNIQTWLWEILQATKLKSKGSKKPSHEYESVDSCRHLLANLILKHAPAYKVSINCWITRVAIVKEKSTQHGFQEPSRREKSYKQETQQVRFVTSAFRSGYLQHFEVEVKIIDIHVVTIHCSLYCCSFCLTLFHHQTN